MQDHVAAARIKRGDRVKLNEHGARVNSLNYYRKGKAVDWSARRGTAHRVGKLYVYIRWDGRESIDFQQTCLIEPAED